MEEMPHSHSSVRQTTARHFFASYRLQRSRIISNGSVIPLNRKQMEPFRFKNPTVFESYRVPCFQMRIKSSFIRIPQDVVQNVLIDKIKSNQSKCKS